MEEEEVEVEVEEETETVTKENGSKINETRERARERGILL